MLQYLCRTASICSTHARWPEGIGSKGARQGRCVEFHSARGGLGSEIATMLPLPTWLSKEISPRGGRVSLDRSKGPIPFHSLWSRRRVPRCGAGSRVGFRHLRRERRCEWSFFIRDFELDLSAMRHCITCVLDQIAQDDEQLMGVCNISGRSCGTWTETWTCSGRDIVWSASRICCSIDTGQPWFRQASNVGEGGDGMIDEVDLIVDPKKVLPQFLLCCPFGMEK